MAILPYVDMVAPETIKPPYEAPSMEVLGRAISARQDHANMRRIDGQDRPV